MAADPRGGYAQELAAATERAYVRLREHLMGHPGSPPSGRASRIWRGGEPLGYTGSGRSTNDLPASAPYYRVWARFG